MRTGGELTGQCSGAFSGTEDGRIADEGTSSGEGGGNGCCVAIIVVIQQSIVEMQPEDNLDFCWISTAKSAKSPLGLSGFAFTGLAYCIMSIWA